MRRVASISLLLLLLLAAAPGVAATPPPAPTLTATEGPAWTELSWTAPSGANPSAWNFVRDADDDRFDFAEQFPSTTTSFLDPVVPLPGDRFRYTVTYVEQGDESEPSNVVERGPIEEPCLHPMLGEPGCCPITRPDCAKAEACGYLGPFCDSACPVLDRDLTRVVHELICLPQWDPCPYFHTQVLPAIGNQLVGVCRLVFP